ncbi:MAG: type transport system ATP-binding protein [Thermoanaerobaculia bacterium]|jgi:ABC-type multidrug transport system ATPase subunit|nr:type transport system ATP-binding protein [Thermoanaerobaculia bacterium]
MKPLIELHGIRKTYSDGHEALRGIDLALGEGMFGLLGPNGAGKTTLLSILVLALEPTAGTMHFQGIDASSGQARTAIRKQIGFLPQDFQPLRHLTGAEYLVHCARLRGIGLTKRKIDRRARMLLDAVDLTDAADRLSGEYSGGMRRRLGIAQALIHAPRMLVIDEPTAGLDPEERIRFRNLIAEVAEEVTVLLSTHISEDIEATCNRIAVLTNGVLVFDGGVDALMARGGDAASLEEAYAAELQRHGSLAA